MGLGAILLFSIVAGHADCQAPGRDRFIKVFFPGGRSVTAELAVTDEERARGLMFRDKVLPGTRDALCVRGRGLAFVLDEKHSGPPGHALAWARPAGSSTSPGTSRPAPLIPARPTARKTLALFVLELKAGQADVLGLKLQDRLEFVCRPGSVEGARGT